MAIPGESSPPDAAVPAIHRYMATMGSCASRPVRNMEANCRRYSVNDPSRISPKLSGRR